MPNVVELIENVEAIIEQTIRLRLADQWKDADGNQLTAIQYPAIKKLVNVDGQFLNEAPTKKPWIRLETQWFGNQRVTISDNENSLNLNDGVIQLTVFAPDGEGLTTLAELRGKARKIFDCYDGQGGLRCRSSEPKSRYKDGAWIVGVTLTEFQVYERRG